MSSRCEWSPNPPVQLHRTHHQYQIAHSTWHEGSMSTAHVTVCTAISCLAWQENACSCYKKTKNNFVKNRLLTYYQYYHRFLYSAWIFLVLQHIFDPAWLDKYWVSDKSVDGTSVRLWKLQPAEVPNTSSTGLWKLQPGSKMAEFPCKWVGS